MTRFARYARFALSVTRFASLAPLAQLARMSACKQNYKKEFARPCHAQIWSHKGSLNVSTTPTQKSILKNGRHYLSGELENRTGLDINSQKTASVFCPFFGHKKNRYC